MKPKPRIMSRIMRCAVGAFCAVWMAAAPGLAKAEPLLLNFRDVDIRQIIETVGELTGRNFLIDPRVKAKVTILANTEVPEEALYDVLLAILSMHGFRAVDGLGLTRILPVNLAPRFPPTEVAENLVTEILRIEHLAAPTVVPIIKPLMTQQAQVAVHKDGNLILLTETRANIDRVKTIIGKIDREALLDYEIIQLRHVLATDAVKIISRAIPKTVRGLVQVISETDGNRIIMTGAPEVRLSVRALLAELDTPVKLSKVEGSLRVYPLKFAKAEDVEEILRGLLNSRFLESASVADDGKTTAKKTTKKADKKKTDKKATVTSKKDRNKGKKYVVQSDPATNSIIVGGTPEVLGILEDMIKRLDVPRPQVLIEAIIADVSDEKAEQLGTQFNLGGTVGPDGTLIPGAAMGDNGTYKGLLGVFSSGSLQLGAQALTRFSGADGARAYAPLGVLINAIRRNSDAEVLSTPSILTLNNETAIIDVSDERSVLTGDSLSSSSDFRRTYERIKFGTRLEVLPQITEDDAVRLEIRQVVEDIDEAGTEAADRPNTRSREIETKVVVNDGDILVLGGLARSRRVLNDNKMPFLSDIPLIGGLFRNREDRSQHTNLILFIRPIILRNAEESAELSNERYAAVRLRQLLKLRDTSERGLLEKHADTVLPNFGEQDEEVRKKKRRAVKAKEPRRRVRSRRPDAYFDEPHSDLYDGKPPRKKRVIKRKKRRRLDDV